MDEKKIKTFSGEWFATHNFLPFLATGLLALIGIVNYFAGVNTKVEVLQMQVTNFASTINLLNDTIDSKLKTVDLAQKCSAVLSASSSAHNK